MTLGMKIQAMNFFPFEVLQISTINSLTSWLLSNALLLYPISYTSTKIWFMRLNNPKKYFLNVFLNKRDIVDMFIVRKIPSLTTDLTNKYYFKKLQITSAKKGIFGYHPGNKRLYFCNFPIILLQFTPQILLHTSCKDPNL